MVACSHDRGLRVAAPDPKELLETSGDHNAVHEMTQDAYLPGLTAFLDKHVE